MSRCHIAVGGFMSKTYIICTVPKDLIFNVKSSKLEVK